MATSGPGAIHLLNGLYDAKLDNAPVVAIVGQQKRMSLGGVTDPEVPPLPPHIRMEHAQGFARALLHGDPGSAHIVRQSLREKLKNLVTR